MLEAGATIAQTAAATGFADQSHLHRHFKRTLGLTPAKYQQRFNGGPEKHGGTIARPTATAPDDPQGQDRTASHGRMMTS
jgi:hypothetical protein